MRYNKKIAIVSTNKNRYSETFIHNHVKLLPAQIHFLFDGYLPKKYSVDKGKTEQRFKTKEQTFFKKFFKRNKEEISNEELQNSIYDYLLLNQIEIVLAEYGPSGVEMMPVCNQLNIPLIVHFHGYDAYRNDIMSSYGVYYRELFQKASAVIGVSKDMCSQLEKLGCPKSKINYLPYGIDTRVFQFHNRPKTENKFVFCGRFVAKKAPESVIHAFAKCVDKFADARLIMIGEGDLLEKSKTLATVLKLTDSIQFTGALSQQDIALHYSNALAFVQHSITTVENDSEGTPLAIMEAGAAGLPVISTWHAGIPDVVEDGLTGFLVKEKDVNAMAEKMIYVLENPIEANEMGRRAYEKIRTRHSLEQYTKELWEVINKS